MTAAPATAQTWRTVTSARQLQNESELIVNVQYGVGRFVLRPGAGGELYRMRLRYDEDRFTPVREFDAATGHLRVGVRGRDGVRVSFSEMKRNERPPQLDLGLSPDVPLSLLLELGAVEADVELGGLALRRAAYRTGASSTMLRFSRANPVDCEELLIEAGAASFEAQQLANSRCARVSFRGGVGDVTLDFGGSFRQSMDVQAHVGLGSLNLRLPRDVGVTVELNRFLASFDASGFTRRGNTFVSANYDTARYRLTLHVNASIGGVEVAWID